MLGLKEIAFPFLSAETLRFSESSKGFNSKQCGNTHIPRFHKGLKFHVEIKLQIYQGTEALKLKKE
jgi:hypothetical protein